MIIRCAFALCVLLLAGSARSQVTANASALRAAVPLLCTENRLAAHTRVRGTGVIADSGGSLITAAHVIQQADPSCTLSVMVPDREWSHVRELHTFLVTSCKLDQPLDLAACRLRPAARNSDWGLLRGASIHLRSALPGEAVTVTAFAGWGMLPFTARGHIKGNQTYARRDGCYCDFATDIPAEQGMSGSPVVSAQGEVLGILTLAGTGKFKGMSFGVAFDEAADFLRAQGVNFAPLPPLPKLATGAAGR
jgi:S1-C subfamily serine protease